MATQLEDEIARLGGALDRLAPGARDREALEHLVADAQARMPWPRLHRALLERVELMDTARDRLALTLHATDADVAGTAAGKGELAGVFEVLVAAADAESLDVYLARAQAILEENAMARGDLPSVDRLIEIANQVEKNHEETADALVSLAQKLEDLAELDAADA